jgi:hypothetical protein
MTTLRRVLTSDPCARAPVLHHMADGRRAAVGARQKAEGGPRPHVFTHHPALETEIMDNGGGALLKSRAPCFFRACVWVRVGLT